MGNHKKNILFIRGRQSIVTTCAFYISFDFKILLVYRRNPSI